MLSLPPPETEMVPFQPQQRLQDEGEEEGVVARWERDLTASSLARSLPGAHRREEEKKEET